MKEWAVITGRYREGIDVEDWVSWKTRLRCALNKAQDIVECRSESRVQPEDFDPYKVYEFIQREYPVYVKCVLLDTITLSRRVTVCRGPGKSWNLKFKFKFSRPDKSWN